MKIDISSILEDKGSTLRVQGAENPHFDEFTLDGPLNLNLTLTNMGNEVLMNGTARGALRLSCASCLTDFAFPLSLNLSEEFFPLIQARSHAEEESTLEELAIFTYGADRVLDLSETIRQAVLLALPMHPTCRTDCKGLCSRCGKNRNEGECACPRESISPTDEIWAPLKALQNPAPGKKRRRNFRA